MKYGIEILLRNEKIPKDKNRIFISLIKNLLSDYNKEYYLKLYEETINNRKDFTFSLYMGRCEFLREEILIPEKKIYLNFSTCNYEEGIMIYNALLNSKGKEYPIKDNSMKIQRINLLKEKSIYTDNAIFKTLSPIVIREHKGDNKKTWYHSLNTEEGLNVFKENLKYQLIDKFGEELLDDFNQIGVELSSNNKIKEVKVKNYNIEVLSNVGIIKVKAKPYILDYLYKSGVGSLRNSGFGMVDIV